MKDMTERPLSEAGLPAFSWRAAGLLAAVSIVLGSAFPVIEIAIAGGIPPVTLATARILLAALAVAALAAACLEV